MPHTVSSMGIFGDFIFFHSEDLQEPILKKSAFSIFFPGLAKIEPNAPGLYMRCPCKGDFIDLLGLEIWGNFNPYLAQYKILTIQHIYKR